MDCKAAEELIEPFLLGALDFKERQEVASHIGYCVNCASSLNGDDETVVRLALSVPQLETPQRVKTRLFKILDDETRKRQLAAKGLGIVVVGLGRYFFGHAGHVMASGLIIGLVAGGLWFNFRFGDEFEEVDDSQNPPSEAANTDSDEFAQVETSVELGIAQAQPTSTPTRQRRYIDEAARGSSVQGSSINMLWGTGWTAGARGMMLSSTGTEALLLTVDLPPLGKEQVYQIWLIKGGRRYRAGTFTVDSTGYGQAVIIPVAPLAEFEAIGITIEPSEGSEGPTGTSVLKGDL